MATTTSLLSLPAEVKQDIGLALILASGDLTTATKNLLNFLSISQSVYWALNRSRCPKLYADIFLVYFDPPLIRVSEVALATELTLRCRAIRLIRQHNMQVFDDLNEAHQLLWTACLMTLESTDRNIRQLEAIHVSAFCDRVILRTEVQDEAFLKAIILWLRFLTLTTENIHATESFPPEIFDCIVSTILARGKTEALCCEHPPIYPNVRYGNPFRRSLQVSYYCRNLIEGSLDPMLAALLIRFAWVDVRERPAVNVLPYDQPETLSDINALGRDDIVTKDDCRAVGTCTPIVQVSKWFSMKRTVAELIFCNENIRAPDASHDLGTTLQRCQYGSLSGLWEGMYMLFGHHPCHGWTFIARNPMQFDIREHAYSYLSHTPRKTAKRMQGYQKEEQALYLPMLQSHDEYVDMHQDDFYQDGYSLHECPATSLDAWVVTGETLGRHQAAWGAYRFAGRARKNGPITFVRQAKVESGADIAEKLYFRGHLVFHSTIVGTFESLVHPRQQGIFCMQKKS